MTRNGCRGPALVLPADHRPFPHCWPAHRLDGHRFAGDQEQLQGPCPGIPLTDHQLLAGTTCSMATGCAGDQERLQGPCPGTHLPITSCWPAPP
ncbi:hypothetical protein, partial [Aeromonas sp. 700722]|uniref:hypothetical protein n=1 Tax=Aeromonas sp. 700722 TaxID=2712057 RepID=UPI003B9DD91E